MNDSNANIVLRLIPVIILFLVFPAWVGYRAWKKGEKKWVKTIVTFTLLGLGPLIGVTALLPQKFRGIGSLLIIYAFGFLVTRSMVTDISSQELAFMCSIGGLAFGILWLGFISTLGKSTTKQNIPQNVQNQTAPSTRQEPVQTGPVQNYQTKHEPVITKSNSYTPVQKTIREPHPVAKMKYFEVPCPSGWQARCSDDECPCGSPGAPIARGSGYLYISRDVVEFRRDALSLDEAEEKLESVRRRSGFNFIVGIEKMAVPVLICERGARRRGLDLEAAAADAKYWWETELVPLRPTPLLGSI